MSVTSWRILDALRRLRGGGQRTIAMKYAAYDSHFGVELLMRHDASYDAWWIWLKIWTLGILMHVYDHLWSMMFLVILVSDLGRSSHRTFVSSTFRSFRLAFNRTQTSSANECLQMIWRQKSSRSSRISTSTLQGMPPLVGHLLKPRCLVGDSRCQPLPLLCCTHTLMHFTREWTAFPTLHKKWTCEIVWIVPPQLKSM